MVLENNAGGAIGFARPKLTFRANGPKQHVMLTVDICGRGSEKSLPTVHTRLPEWFVQMYVHGAAVCWFHLKWKIWRSPLACEYTAIFVGELRDTSQCSGSWGADQRQKLQLVQQEKHIQDRRGEAEARVELNPVPTNRPYFHSQILETVLPAASTSYSKAPQLLLSCASFCDAV
jgi:hypothetical protein